MIILDPISVSNPGVFVSSNVPEDDYPVQVPGKVYAAGDLVMDPVNHLNYESKLGARSAVTISIASPGVVTWVAHALPAGTPISFDTSVALPTGFVAGVVYYLRAPAADNFTLSATVGGAAINTSGTQSGVHTATAGQNIGRALTDTVYWLPKGATNRWKMFDEYNNTQTEHADSIVFTVRPQAIAQALYLGNVEGDEVVITGVDPTAGTVHSETTSLVISKSASSMFNWLFKRIRRRRQFCTVTLPAYYAATFEVRINRPGRLAKCGMVRIGPLEDVGLSQYGLEAEIKDYSSTRFNFDGTSETTLRGYSKKMSLDVVVDNDVIDELHDRMIDFRQKTVVFIGAKGFDLSLVCGVYSSFKTVITEVDQSKISIQIEGKV
jgi:hypothetical protein